MELSSGTIDVYNQLNAGTAWDQSLMTDIGTADAGLVQIRDQLALEPGTEDAVAELDAMISSGTLSSFQTHAASQFENLPANLTAFTNYSAMNQSLSGGGITDLCAGINDIFGSVLGAGAALIGSVMQGIQQVLGLIAQGVSVVLGAIMTAIQGIAGVLAEIASMILGEQSLLGQMMQQLLMLTNALNLQNLLRNPCAKTALTIAGSAGMLSALGVV